jgi:hypothetical protein
MTAVETLAAVVGMADGDGNSSQKRVSSVSGGDSGYGRGK